MYGPGWHLPGGVLRFKETLKDRLLKTLDSELGIVKADIKGPVGFHEIFNKHRDVRGHFIFLFRGNASEVQTPNFNQAISHSMVTGDG